MMRYTITPISDYALQVYPVCPIAGGKLPKPLIVKLSPGSYAYGNLIQGNWLYCGVKGQMGWVDLRQCKVHDAGATVPPPVPASSTLGWVLGDWHIYGMSNIEWAEQYIFGHPIKNPDGTLKRGLPQPIKYYETARVDIRKDTDTRRLWFEAFSAAAPASLKSELPQRFAGLIKNGVCYSDHAGNTGFNQIITGDNVVYLMGEPVKQGGGIWRPVRMLHVGKYDYMLKQLMNYPYLAHNATNSVRDYGGRGVEPFPHLGGADVKVLNFCKDKINWLPEYRIKVLSADEPIPSSYYPPRGSEAIK
jgi:hypothetical protein